MRREKKIFVMVATLIVVFFFLVFYKLYTIQIVRHEELGRYSSSSEVVRVIKGRRGTIYDRHGEVLAISEPRVDLAVDPKGIKDKKTITAILADILGEDESKILRILQKRSNFRYIKKDVSYDVVKRIHEIRQKAVSRLRDLERKRGLENGKEEERRRLQQLVADLNNVILVDGFKRIYPQGKLLANVLGWVLPHTNEGLEGLEKVFDRYLSGGEIKVRRLSVPGIGEGMLEVEKETGGKQGADLYLTIDIAIQMIAEEELDKMVEKSKAKWGAVVIMEPSTGRILAMANNPSFFPEEYDRFPLERRRNRAIANLFEPGSTLKVFSILAAMNENTVRPGEKFNGFGGSFRYGGRIIRDHEGRGIMTLEDVVVYSSNIGTVQIVDRISSETLYAYLQMFGFFRPSGLQVLGEAVMKKIRPPAKWMPIDKANISFGQGVGVNMVQMVSAISSLFNGGVLWRPTLVDRAVSPFDGRVVYESLPSFSRIEFKYQSDKKMITMMKGVVERGTAKKAALDGVTVAGKTGTSQKFDRELGKYSMEKEVCSFVGVAPVEDPKLAMMVIIDEPEGREYGGTVAAPVFREIARRVLPLLGVYVGREKKRISVAGGEGSDDVTGAIETIGSESIPSAIEIVSVPAVEGMPANRAMYLLNQAGLDVVVSGNPSSVVRRQSPRAGEHVPYGASVIVETEEEKEASEVDEGEE